MRRALISILASALLGLSGPVWAAPTCFGDDADCDADGFSVTQGDCDDHAATVRPGAPEICGDEADNDCNGLFDDGCDRSAQLGTAQGGGGCTGGAGVAGTAWIFLPLFLGRRRRT